MPYFASSGPTVTSASFLEIYGHSYVEQPIGLGVTLASITPDQSGEMDVLLANALDLTPAEVRSHAMTGAQLTAPGRSNSGFARVLAETYLKNRRQTMPFLRNGGAFLFCYGINDLGNQGTVTVVQNVFRHAYRMAISRARASAIYLASGGANWSFGTNFAAAAATYVDQTSGAAMRATAIDSAGTGTATFRIPLGYQGEPLAFAFLGANGATGCDITWGGTVTGTAGIIGTVTTTDTMGVGTNKGVVCVRFTAAANGLSSSNAGQTITMKVTRVSASGECVIDSAWIEATKPNPVVVCNVPRLPCRKITLRVGDLTTTSGSTTATSTVAAFASGTDAGNTITQISGTAAIPAGTTIASVTNATTVVLSAAATATATVVADFQRTMNGYTQYSGNTNFSGATPASHAAADADVATMNTWITAAVAEFDSMVQIADLDTALGFGDTVRPPTVYTYFAFLDGLHPNELGNARCADAMVSALGRLAPVDPIDLGNLNIVGSPCQVPGPDRFPRRTGSVYMPVFSGWNTAQYTCVVGDMFALPMVVTEWGETWSTGYVHQFNAPVTSGSSVRWAVYDDVWWTGYPQTMWKEPTSAGAAALGTTAGMKTITSMGSWNMRPGLYWLVLKVDALGTTASQLNQINGPNPYMPGWNQTIATGAVPTATTPSGYIAWKLTGQAAGTMPGTFPAGATAVVTAPAIGFAVT